MVETGQEASKKRVARRNYPTDTLEAALSIAKAISNERAGLPLNRLLLAEALGIKPGSSNYRDLLSSSFKYGLTEGTEKASEISLTPLGADAAQSGNMTKRRTALRRAALTPETFRNFYEQYNNNRLPSSQMLAKILTSDFKVPAEHGPNCASLILENGRFVDIIRDIGGSPHVLLDVGAGTDYSGDEGEEVDHSDQIPEPEPLIPAVTYGAQVDASSSNGASSGAGSEGTATALADKPAKTQHSSAENLVQRPIFIGHGKKHEPLEKLKQILTSFDIRFKVVGEEANMGRPIPQKVKDTMLQCGSAILIFTKDVQLQDAEGNEVWRPSENVVHELGAASYAYEDRVVIFKEEGIHFPTNYSSIGYIEFAEANFEAKTMELFKELQAFGLIKITTA